MQCSAPVVLEAHRAHKREAAPKRGTQGTGLAVSRIDSYSVSTLTGILGPKMTLLQACQYLASEQGPSTQPAQMAAVPALPLAAGALVMSLGAMVGVAAFLRSSAPVENEEEYAAMPQ